MLSLAPFGLGHEFAWRYRWIVGRRGEFERGSDTDDARRLSRLANERWFTEFEYRHVPLGTPAHVRFHSLPNSKRYAETPEEHAEILRRHYTVLTELLGDEPESGLVCVAVDHPRRDLLSGWTAKLLPGRWPWRIITREDMPESPWYLWVATGLSRSQLDLLLTAVAEDVAGKVWLTSQCLDWFYAPYDGGVDVFLATAAERDALRARHENWLSAHPDGL